MLVQVVGGEVVDRCKGIGNGDNRLGDGQRLGSRNGHSRRSSGTDRRGSHEIGREGVLSIVHEVLNELEVLGLELLTGSLKTVDLLKLGLLLGQGLADDLAGLGVGLVADAVRSGAPERRRQVRERPQGRRERPARQRPEPEQAGPACRRAAARWRSDDP